MRIVAVGASAGGLKALTAMFQGCREHDDYAFIVVQHLSPDHKSMMPQLLGRHTDLKVIVAEDDSPVEPGCIYLNTPQTDLMLDGGTLRVRRWTGGANLRQPIDTLFESVADSLGDRATAVVLSGSGGDGARGMRRVARCGGLTVAQEPETAGFDSMPVAAINTGKVALVRAPEDIGETLSLYAEPPYTDWIDDENRVHLEAIFDLLHGAFGLNLRFYKLGTVRRRVSRRVHFANFEELGDYVEFLRRDPEEQARLHADLLIGTTRFFRDTPMFASLAAALSTRPPDAGEELRVWVTGCATGEEAYSIAMMLIENVANPESVKVFATDIDEHAIAHASQGVYTDQSLQVLSSERRSTFFTPHGERWKVRPALRRAVVFAVHDLLRDPPFSSMNLVSCRNMLIYLNEDGQRIALQHLLFALDVDGVLVLGPSEAPGAQLAALQPIDTRWNIFRKHSNLNPRMTARPKVFNRPLGGAGLPTPRISRELERAYDGLLDIYAPPGLLLDAQRQLLHTFGDAARHLIHRPGRRDNDVLSQVPPELKASLGAALYRSQRDRVPVAFRHPQAEVAGEAAELDVVVRPLPAGDGVPFYFVEFGVAAMGVTQPAHIDSASAREDRAEALERELAWTREALQATLERAETTTEELQSTNEELQAANEELQSTNEELQSVNEELHTVNSEYQANNAELIQLSEDMFHLLQSTQIGVIFLDENLEIRKFTLAATHYFNLRPGDEGRPLGHLATSPMQRQAVDRARACIAGEGPSDITFTSAGRELLLQVRPYVGPGRGPSGVVVSIVDMSRARVAEDRVRLQDAMLDALPMGVTVWRLEDPDDAGSLRFLYANEAGKRLAGIDDPGELGRQAWQSASGAVEASAVETWRQVVLTGAPYTETRSVTDGADGRRRQRVLARPGPDETVIVIVEDITDDRPSAAPAADPEPAS